MSPAIAAGLEFLQGRVPPSLLLVSCAGALPEFPVSFPHLGLHLPQLLRLLWFRASSLQFSFRVLLLFPTNITIRSPGDEFGNVYTPKTFMIRNFSPWISMVFHRIMLGVLDPVNPKLVSGDFSCQTFVFHFLSITCEHLNIYV